MVHWMSSSIFPCSSFVRLSSCYGNIQPILRFFNIYRHKSLVLTQFHLIPYWPSNIIYQPALPHTDPVLSCINQYRPIVTIKMTLTLYGRRAFHTFFFPNSTVRLSFVDLRWAQLYVSLVFHCIALMVLCLLSNKNFSHYRKYLQQMGAFLNTTEVSAGLIQIDET